MTEDKDFMLQEGSEKEMGSTPEERFPELIELEDEIKSRIRSNQRFLERFMDEDFEDDDVEEDEPENFEEL